jgi:cytosine deaminase
MPMDLIVRNTRLTCDGPLVDIGVQGGRIAAIASGLAAEAADMFDAGGCFACAGLCETHIHLEKSRIMGLCAPEPSRAMSAMQRVSAVKQAMDEADIFARARTTLERCLEGGTTRMRAHVEVDSKIGLRGYHAVRQLAREYAWAVDLEICVFPQEGLTNNSESLRLMREVLRDGVRAVGAAPDFDPDPTRQIEMVFALAREFDVELDLHLDNANTAERFDVLTVCELTEKYRRGGRVAVGHMCRLSVLPPDELRAMAGRLAAAGVAVTVLPATDLFMMGRDQTYAVRRGVADATVLAGCGVTCSISTNNVLNPFTPYGDGSLVRMANLQANICQVSDDASLAGLFGMVTERSARLMNLADYGLRVGNPADIVVLDADGPAQVVAELRAPLAAFKRGRRTLTRSRPILHFPEGYQ